MNDFTNSLQKYKKPNKEFLKEKDCIICLELVDIEAQKIVQLPCLCANSVFHIDCLVKFLQSGENKNFCPHCRGIYIMETQKTFSLLNTRIVPLEIVYINSDNFQENRKMVYIFIIHFFLNSILNIINLSSIYDSPNKNIDILGKIIMINCLCKLIINSYFIINIKDNIEKISFWLAYSYTFQSILFILIISLISLLKKNQHNIILLLNNIFFFIGDLIFRLFIDYNRQNRVANIT
jgi:hypothetical protein